MTTPTNNFYASTEEAARNCSNLGTVAGEATYTFTRSSFVIGGLGEQLTLRVVAQHADVWNCPGYPHLTAAAFQHKSHIVDEYCAAIERDPASLARSVQVNVDPAENPASTREIVHQFIAAGATHLVLGPRTPNEGIAHWLSEEIIQPLCEAIGATLA
jgi:alkanesulfonate monooxygenase SsuD/methylene tetrahydromethanopterin reductase-like flavin-dependent oxidoreductase (luciferase family)